ncbi:hypothetical protein, partial [Streptomyces sp. NRRL S-1448]|uniref:hypothetical protein n=1 Tax=Streptomyces sp. NRRL S-1448 TaxID=1463883 RepID=UPI001F179E28
SGRFPSVLRFRLYQILAAPIFAGAFRPFGFFAVSDFIRSGSLSIPASDFVGVLRDAFPAPLGVSPL